MPSPSLLRDLERAPEFDQSALFKKVYEEEFGTFGGAPFGALIGDYEFGRHPQDLAVVRRRDRTAVQHPLDSALAACSGGAHGRQWS